MSQEFKEEVIAHATKRIDEGKDRKAFLQEMAVYWEIARKRLENREREWLLGAIRQDSGQSGENIGSGEGKAKA
jgi:hypothetical protein